MRDPEDATHPPDDLTERQTAALASPQRMEIVSLFGESDTLAVSDIAARIGRPATSIYHHLDVLLAASILRPAGTRPKGKRYERLYAIEDGLIRLELDPTRPGIGNQARKAMRSALRMAERDFEAALSHAETQTEGPERNLTAMRVHMRATPALRAALNEHLAAIEALLLEHGSDEPPGPADEFLSLTLVLAPLRGRAPKPEEDDR